VFPRSEGDPVKVLQRYFAKEIIRSVLFVLVAFLALFAFFDLISELKAIGNGGYRLEHAFGYVLLKLPSYAYELIPIAALIGTIWVMAQFASQSEFTIMRVSSMSTLMAASMLVKIGVLFAVATFLFGEFVSPKASELGERLKLSAQGASVSQQFRSGLWAKDVIRSESGAPIGSRFINVKQVQPTGELQGVKIYEFDQDFRMAAMITAASGVYRGPNTWLLSNVSETRFPAGPVDSAESLKELATAVSTQTLESRKLASDITPEILAVLFADPDTMSAYDLSAYVQHLKENKQRAERYEIAFWKKLTYPFAVFVMMALALPFAYLHFRSGGVSLKIFTGIMIGVSFQLINSLFAHLGLLNTWPALTTAVTPSILFLLVAIAALFWVERH
jgi:lipopolysaccharide export system permease protein